jgi:hypothetical protein
MPVPRSRSYSGRKPGREGAEAPAFPENRIPLFGPML